MAVGELPPKRCWKSEMYSFAPGVRHASRYGNAMHHAQAADIAGRDGGQPRVVVRRNGDAQG